MSTQPRADVQERHSTAVDDATARLIDAGERCLLRDGAERLTVSSLTVEAGISRTAFYRSFADRDALLLAIILHESTPIFDRAHRRLARADHRLAGVLPTVFTHAVREFLDNPYLARLLRPDSAARVSRLMAFSKDLADRSRAGLAPHLRRAAAAGQLRPRIAPDTAVDWLLRIAISFLLEGDRDSPGREDKRRRELVRDYVVPAIFLP